MNIVTRLFEKFHIESIWDFLAWLSLASIFIWALAKAFGWINTPDLVQLYPIFAAVFFAGRAYHDLHNLKIEVRRHDERLAQTESRLLQS